MNMQQKRRAVKERIDFRWGALGLVITFIVLVTMCSSCMGERDRTPPRPVKISKLFQLEMVYDDGTRVNAYGYAADKYDVERMFNDSLQLESNTLIKQYSIKEIKAVNKQFRVIK